MPSLQVQVRVRRVGGARKRWYAARLRFAVLTDRVGLERFVDSVVLLEALHRDQAFERALERGRAREQAYCSHDGLRVRWCLARVASLDEIPDEDWNGVELMAIPVEPSVEDIHAIGFDHTFAPELSRPEQTRA